MQSVLQKGESFLCLLCHKKTAWVSHASDTDIEGCFQQK